MKKNYQPFIFFSVLCVLFTATVSAQINVTSNQTATQLMNALVGTGAVVSNPVLVCPNGASGTFTNGNTTNLGITAGVLLTTGSATAVNGTAASFASVDNLGSGNSLLTGMAGATTYEECRLEFDIMPTCSSLQMSYVFGSEEYPEWVGAGYNDAFGFFVSGPNPGGGNYTNTNIALVPGTSTFVGIDNVNSSSNSAYYVDNSASTTIAYDGLTTVLTASISVTACQTYHMILVIADGGDGVYDSGVFLTFQGLTCPAPVVTASGATSICPGQSATLTASGMTNYTWQPGGSTGSSVTVSPSSTTTYTVTGTSGLCNVDTAVVTVTVSAPSVSANNSGPYCIGSTVSLSTSGGGTYSWSGPNGFTSTAQNPTISNATAAEDGVYTVTVTAGGCTTTATTSVTVSPPPTPSSSNSGPYCEGTTINLSSSGGSTYSWSGPNGFTDSNQNPSISSATTAMSGVYTVTVAVGSCTATSSTTVTVDAAPVPTASNSGPYCEGSAINLSSSGGGTYAWSGPNGFTDSNQNPSIGVSTTSMSGVYTVTVTLGNCSSTSTTSVTVNAIPVAVSSNTGPYCEGSTIDLSSSGGTSYSWSGPSSYSSAVQNPSITTSTAAMSGIYTVTVANGPCSSTATTSVTVNANPVSTASNTGPYCIGSQIDLAAGGGGNYSWTGPNGFSSSTQNPSIPNITSADAGVYTVTVTDATTGCNSTATTSVSVNTSLVPSLNSNGPLCAGDSLSLSCGNGVSWSWSGPNGFSSSNQNISIDPVTTNEAGTYSVTVTDAQGCSGNSTVVVNINPLPVVTAAATSICAGDTGIITASGANNYSWSAGTTPSTGASVNATPSSNTTYTVTGVDANGCVDTATVTLNVNSLPVITATSGSICPGMSDTLIATGAQTFTWSAGTTSISANQDSVSVTPAATTSYTVTGTDANGCVDTTITTVTVSNTGLTLTMSANAVICNGDSTTLNASGALSYTWNPGGVSGSAVTVSPSSTTIYTVNASDANGCTGTGTVTVDVAPTMTTAITPVNVTCNNQCNGQAGVNVSPSSGPFSAYTYVWSNGSTTDTTSSTLCPGVYNVVITDGAGCVTSDSVTITQPTALSVTLSSTNVLCNGNSTGSASVNVSGGSPVYTYLWSNGGSSSSQSNLAAGTYTAVVADANNCMDTVVITITQPTAITMTLTPTNITCVNPAGSVNSTVSGGTPGYTYSWAPSGSGQSPSGLPANTYTLTVTDTNNCVVTQTVVVTSNTVAPGADAGQTAMLNCGNSSLNLNGSSSTGGVSYSWSGPGGFTASTSNPSITTPGVYTITVTNPVNGCTSSDTVTITQATIDASFTNNPGSGIAPLTVTFLNTSTNATSYVWDFGNGTTSFSTNDTTTYLTSGVYTVTLYATNPFGCLDSATATIVVNDPTAILVPNVFTPNGDGTNDIFFITSTGLSELNVLIFDRWGIKMAEITSLNGGWNGKTPSGADASDGTYYYMVKAKGIDGKDLTQEGYMLLAR